MDPPSNIGTNIIDRPSKLPKVDDLNEVFAFMLPAMDAVMRPLPPNEPRTKPSYAYYSYMYSTICNMCTTAKLNGQPPIATLLSQKLDDYFLEVASQYLSTIRSAVNGTETTGEKCGEALLQAYRLSWSRYAKLGLPYLNNIFNYFERNCIKRAEDEKSSSLVLSESELDVINRSESGLGHILKVSEKEDLVLQAWRTSNSRRSDNRDTLVLYARAAQPPGSIGGVVLIALRRWRTEVIEKLVEDGYMAKLMDHLTSLPPNEDTRGVCEEIETSLLRSGVDPEGETFKALREQISAIQVVGGMTRDL